jgi:hypothetical protein
MIFVLVFTRVISINGVSPWFLQGFLKMAGAHGKPPPFTVSIFEGDWDWS